jgi:hypothetical protein
MGNVDLMAISMQVHYKVTFIVAPLCGFVQ